MLAVAAGVVLYGALRSVNRHVRSARPTAQRGHGNPGGPGDHDVGSADIEFTSSKPGRKDIAFRFVWKKQPVDAPDADWPVDYMGFVATRPDGKRTALKFTRKSRPLRRSGPQEGPREEPRNGLGKATMEFVSTRHDGKEFKFVWNKVPPGPQDPAAPTTPVDDKT